MTGSQLVLRNASSVCDYSSSVLRDITHLKLAQQHPMPIHILIAQPCNARVQQLTQGQLKHNQPPSHYEDQQSYPP
jgi:uncharacterized protein YlaI